jgi:hypothetical protein
MATLINIGTPNTVGELKEMLSKFTDETTFYFYGQPEQDLFKIINGTNISVVFRQVKEFDNDV